MVVLQQDLNIKMLKKDKLLQEQEFFGKQFLVKDELKTLEWVMGTETKQIGQYTAFKATAVKQVTGTDFLVLEVVVEDVIPKKIRKS